MSGRITLIPLTFKNDEEKALKVAKAYEGELLVDATNQLLFSKNATGGLIPLSTKIEDTLESTNTNTALSAKQGKVIKDLIDESNKTFTKGLKDLDDKSAFYEFIIEFGSDGNPGTFSSIPEGWTITKDSSVATDVIVTHNQPKTVKSINYWSKKSSVESMALPSTGNFPILLAETYFRLRLTRTSTNSDSTVRIVVCF
jgi:hypothetical protein